MSDYKTSDFDFDLPSALIAQTAIEPRDRARLLHVTQKALTDCHVFDLPLLLRSGDLLVLNDTRVIPARLLGMKGTMRIELLLLKSLSSPLGSPKIEPKDTPSFACWQAFAKPGKRLRVGDKILFANKGQAQILEKFETGEVTVRFDIHDRDFFAFLHDCGEPPLPPYIKRERGMAQLESRRYQTIYARHEGAIAAPTAGLHFTPELFSELKKRDIDHVSVTLHVGAGTFLPVKAEYIKDHTMHAEYGEISESAAKVINQARGEKRRIVSVGTTSLRVLESAASKEGQIRPFAEETSIFISPGYSFKVADALITNFHLPQSTLFMLVCAFMGIGTMKSAYAHAITQNYRFYSYGDASLLERL